jgi:[acyl-carrier-protein] S-malonyltransferase
VTKVGYALLFPGQGSQAVGMGRALCAASPAAREVFERADAALGYSLSGLCFEGDEATLTRTEHAQPAIFVNSLATLAALRALAGDRLPAPAYVAGHSLGEYTAVVAGCGLDADRAIALVQTRARLLQRAAEARPGAMAAILALDAEAVEATCEEARALTPDGVVVVANENAPGQIVISGTVEAVEAAMARTKARGARRAMRLPVGGAFHSPLISPVSRELAEVVADAPLRDLAVPLVANVGAVPIRAAEDVRRELVAQLDSRVRWDAGVEAMLAAGVDTFVEVGSGPITAWLKRRGAGRPVSLDSYEAVERFLSTLPAT